MKKSRIQIIKTIVFILVVILLIYLGVKMFPWFQELKTVEGREAFKIELENLGIKGIFTLLFLIVAKIVIVFLPGEPLEIVAGMCYGPIVGTIIVYIGVILTTLLINLMVKKYGKGWIYEIAPKEKLENIENKVLKNPGKMETIIFFLFFIPAVPKDLITYVGSFLPIKTTRFLMISIIARIPAILSSTIVGSQILNGTWMTIAIVYAITYSISLIIGILYKIFTKKIELKKIEKN